MVWRHRRLLHKATFAAHLLLASVGALKINVRVVIFDCLSFKGRVTIHCVTHLNRLGLSKVGLDLVLVAMLVPGLAFLNHQLRCHLNALGFSLGLSGLFVSIYNLGPLIFVYVSEHDVCQAFFIIQTRVSIGHAFSLLHNPLAGSVDFAKEALSTLERVHALNFLFFLNLFHLNLPSLLPLELDLGLLPPEGLLLLLFSLCPSLLEFFDPLFAVVDRE